MSSSSDNTPPSAGEFTAPESAEASAPFSHWRVALMDLVAARLSLIQMESKDATREATRRVALIAVASAAIFFAWALLLAGGVSLLSQSTGWPWISVVVVPSIKKDHPPAIDVDEVIVSSPALLFGVDWLL